MLHTLHPYDNMFLSRPYTGAVSILVNITQYKNVSNIVFIGVIVCV